MNPFFSTNYHPFFIIIFLILIPCNAILHPIDFLALQSLHKSLSDLPGSSFLSSWQFTSDPCSFPGISCLHNRVISLNLGDPRAGFPGLSGRLHPSISNLSALSQLTLVPGHVFGTLPPSLSLLKNLQFLSLTHNYFTGNIPAGLSNLHHLQTLDLSFNSLTGKIPPSIGTLPSLSNLLLSHNHLSSSIPRFTSQTLTRLDLKHNDLSGSIPPLPPSVKYLSLSYNRLSGNVDSTISNLNQLNWLDLSMNRFSGEIPIQVFNFPITNLQLQRNQFSGTVDPADEVTIKTVDLSYNRLTGEVSEKLWRVKNLYLNNNRFRGKVPRRMVEGVITSGMKVLYLQHNYLTGMEIGGVEEVPARSTVCVEYNCMEVGRVEWAACPVRAGKMSTRPAAQCVRSGLGS